MSVSVITHKGEDIIFVDHQGLAGEIILANMKEGSKLVLEKGTGVLCLTNFKDASLSKQAVAYVKGDEMKQVVKCFKKDAFVGLGGIQKVVFNIYLKLTGSSGKIFNSMDEAKDYLVS